MNFLDDWEERKREQIDWEERRQDEKAQEDYAIRHWEIERGFLDLRAPPTGDTQPSSDSEGQIVTKMVRLKAEVQHLLGQIEAFGDERELPSAMPDESKKIIETFRFATDPAYVYGKAMHQRAIEWTTRLEDLDRNLLYSGSAAATAVKDFRDDVKNLLDSEREQSQVRSRLPLKLGYEPPEHVLQLLDQLAQSLDKLWIQCIELQFSR